MPRIWLFGRDINTDQILPGKYAPVMVGDENLHKYPFCELRPEFPQEVQPGDVIVAGPNFGCGSSREYAPEALKRVKISGIIAPSFARIFFRNALNLGLPLFQSDTVPAQVQDGEPAELDVARGVLKAGARTFQLPPPPEFLREALKEGSILAYFKKYQRFPGT